MMSKKNSKTRLTISKGPTKNIKNKKVSLVTKKGKFTVSVGTIITVALLAIMLVSKIWPQLFEDTDPSTSLQGSGYHSDLNQGSNGGNQKGPGTEGQGNQKDPGADNQDQQGNIYFEGDVRKFLPAQENLLVHFIDVGQGDCVFIEQGTKTMLIDAGPNDKGSKVVAYLKSKGITKLDYVIGTHPHEDHIGGLDDVIKAFDVKIVILPDVITTTRTFEEVLDAISDKGLRVTKAIHGKNYKLGEADFQLVGPINISSKDLNNASVVTRLTFGENSFLFTGDAETRSESEILKEDYVVQADVLKVGHHGSNTSSSQTFLKAVNPSYAIIMSEEGNSYGHPTQNILNRLKNLEISILRVDTYGTIIAKSDGRDLSFWREKG